MTELAPPTLAERAGVQDRARAAACAALLARVRDEGLGQVRIAWGDLHGTFRGKTLVLRPGAPDGDSALRDALDDGIGLVGTVLLKDTSDRTAVKVFEAEGADPSRSPLPALAGAGNVLLLPDPASFVVLPWTEGAANGARAAGAPADERIGWLRAEPVFADGRVLPIDPRRVLQRALEELAQRGFGLRCGLEVEFHVHRIVSERAAPERSAWPAEPPEVELLHPGYDLLAEAWADRAHEALAIVRRTALGLGLPLRSLEIELGPSQFEAVFDATDALTAADQLLLFRNGVRQALHRAGYHASFVCKLPEPPFASSIASGWHLHQSLFTLDGGERTNAFTCEAAAGSALDARRLLSDTGAMWLAGLLAHARALCAIAAPTIPAYSRFGGSVMAPQAALWGRDNRGAMLRVIGAPGDRGTRIENRIGEPLANPYLTIASQIVAGLHGLDARLEPPPATETPYAAPGDATLKLPATLAEALDALESDAVLQAGLGEPMARLYSTIKRQEIARHAAAEDKAAWSAREYFGRY